MTALHRSLALLGVIAAAAISCADATRPEAPPDGTTATGDPPAQTAMMGGVELRLVETADECRIAGPAGEITLSVAPPCRFHRTSSRDVRLVPSDDGVIALVERSVPNPSAPGDCVTTIQAVKVAGGEVRASPYVDTVAMCAPFQWDVQMFTGLWKNP